MYIPNVIHDSVPLGNDEKDNVVIKEWGSKPNFNYPAKGHMEICELLKLVDFKAHQKFQVQHFHYIQILALYMKEV